MILNMLKYYNFNNYNFYFILKLFLKLIKIIRK